MRAYLASVNPFALIVASALVGATAAGGAAAVVADNAGHDKPAHVRKDDRPARAKDGVKDGRGWRHGGKDGKRPGANLPGDKQGKGNVTMDRGGVVEGQGSPAKDTRTSPVAPGQKSPGGTPSPSTLPTPVAH